MWHHDCIIDEEHSEPWCATTLNYKYDQKWGICLKPGMVNFMSGKKRVLCI
jgi:hypothetical protein